MGFFFSVGVDVYKVMLINGVYFGLYLCYVNMDLEKGVWFGSIMIVIDVLQFFIIYIYFSMDFFFNFWQFVLNNIYVYQRWIFWKYDVVFQMLDYGIERWMYVVILYLGCIWYEFVVVGCYEIGWCMFVYFGNDFVLSIN